MEPTITINGTPLSNAQSMTLRVAIELFAEEMITNGLGEDEIGKEIAANYIQRAKEIIRLVHLAIPSAPRKESSQ